MNKRERLKELNRIRRENVARIRFCRAAMEDLIWRTLGGHVIQAIYKDRQPETYP